jgi:hypothetical protein
MDDTDKPQMFRTLRGFLDGHEPDGPNYFKFSATLRVYGDNLPFDQISQTLGIAPTHNGLSADQVPDFHELSKAHLRARRCGDGCEGLNCDSDLSKIRLIRPKRIELRGCPGP